MITRGLLVPVAALIACGGGDDEAAIDAAPPIDAKLGDAAATAPDASAADAAAPDASAADAAAVVLTSTVGFTPGLGQLCGLAYDHVGDRIWVYPCNGAELHAFTLAGAAAGTLARPGEAANDVDLAAAPAAIDIGTTAVAEGALLFVNGETGAAEVHLPDTAGSTPLAAAFGDSHVVGGGYHAARSTVFVVQDRVPAANANTVVEVDPVSGDVVGSFSTLPAFDVNYGDLEVCQATGHLLLVSSNEATIAELTAAGELVGEHALPASVTGASGLGLGPDGQAWISGTGGQVWRLDGLPCGAGP